MGLIKKKKKKTLTEPKLLHNEWKRSKPMYVFNSWWRTTDRLYYYYYFFFFHNRKKRFSMLCKVIDKSKKYNLLYRLEIEDKVAVAEGEIASTGFNTLVHHMTFGLDC